MLNASIPSTDHIELFRRDTFACSCQPVNNTNLQICEVFNEPGNWSADRYFLHPCSTPLKRLFVAYGGRGTER